MRFERRLEVSTWRQVATPFLSIFLAFAVASGILLAAGHAPIATFRQLFQQGFITSGALSTTLVLATPLIFTGLAAAVAFRMEIWNIGAEGQLYAGAIGASAVGLGIHTAPWIAVILMLIGGAVSGAIWALIPALLRAYLHTNEIISTLMFNYLAGLLLTYLIFDSHSFWRDNSPAAGTFPQGREIPAAGAWPSLSVVARPAVYLLAALVIAILLAAWRGRGSLAGLRRGPGAMVLGLGIAAAVVWLVFHSSVSVTLPFGLLIAVASGVALALANRWTRFGLEARVIGDSERTARYVGVRTRTLIVMAMCISGALAGLGGSSQVGDFAHSLDPRGLTESSYGYTGIVVVALARLNPLGVVLVGILLGGLVNGGFAIEGPGFPLGLVGTIEGLLLFFAVGGEVFLAYRLRRVSRGRSLGRRPGGFRDTPSAVVSNE